MKTKLKERKREIVRELEQFTKEFLRVYSLNRDPKDFYLRYPYLERQEKPYQDLREEMCKIGFRAIHHGEIHQRLQQFVKQITHAQDTDALDTLEEEIEWFINHEGGIREIFPNWILNELKQISTHQH